ncbi:MAG: SDR family oxidoreductase [Candidatus Omnitrophica bacterium]|nr:SDR family oxidoreductase [Candidatus Omnitrophota bacterium]
MKKTVLITGGAGFLGSHLCELFLAKGHRVICVDNLLTGKTANIRHLAKNKDLEFVKQDVSKALGVPGPVNYVLHFASPASPPDYMKYPIATLDVGSRGTRNALDLAESKRAVFLMASTSEVYGDPLVNPQPESYWGNVNSIGPRSCYDEAKRFSEALTMAYHRYRKVDTKIVRIFNTYGERMRKNDGRAIPNFACQALANKPITVYGDGSQTRSFCYVSDLVDGIYRLSASAEHEPVNIGNPNEITLLTLAKIIIKLTGSKSKVIYKPLPVDDPKVRRPDITKAKKILKWSPKVRLEEGLARTINYFKASARGLGT